MYRYSMLLGLCLAMAAGVMAPIGAAGARTDAAMLKRIASRLDGRTGVLAIEASTPVPYVASQPDARTFVVELRDVVTAGFEDGFTADPRNPIAAVKVENTQSFDGSAVARVRLTLNQPMRPRVRSARNVIYVEADRVDAAPERRGRHDQSRRTGHRDSRRSRRQAWQRHGADAARHGASRHDEHSGTEGRHAAAGAGHAQRHLVAADGHVDQAGTGRSRAHRRQSEVAADDAGHRRS